MQHFGGSDETPVGRPPTQPPSPPQPGQTPGPGNYGPPPQPGQTPGPGNYGPNNFGQPPTPGWNPQQAQRHKPNALLLVAAMGIGGLVALLGFLSGVDESAGYALGRALGGLLLPAAAGLVTFLITKPKQNPTLIAFIVLASLSLLVNMAALAGT